MRALNRKLVRDLMAMKGQALAISLVVASGVATFIMSVSTLDSLKRTQTSFYRDYRFADVFAALKRAPEVLRTRIEGIPGVVAVETRVVFPATLELPQSTDPITAEIVSLPEHGAPRLNALHIRRGRPPEPGQSTEVLVSEAFAEARRIKPGDHLYAVIRGRRQRLDITGIALSPEYIYQLQPGAFIPDFESFAILWMPRLALGNASDLEGAFNSVVVETEAGARAEDVITRLDILLKPYGGLGAFGRKDQISHRYLSEEFRQLEQMATMFPLIFLSVAMFLLHVVMTRLITTEREQAAILKAFGYSTAQVAIHYLKMAIVIVLVGCAMGIALGAWMGYGMSRMYMDFYRFPALVYEMHPAVALIASLLSAAAAIGGTLHAVLKGARISPAAAMQPATPAKYRVSIVERLGLKRLLDEPTRMIVRNIERRPMRAVLSVTGIGFSLAILVVGGFWSDAIDYMVNIQMKLAQSEDIAVTFAEPTAAKAVYSLSSMPGVQHVETIRSVSARLRFEHRSYRTSITGYPAGATLHLLLDDQLRIAALPSEGLLLTDHLAKLLHVAPGDMLEVEVLEGRRPVRLVPVAGLVKEYVGMAAYMQIEALWRLMDEERVVSAAWLRTDRTQDRRVFRELKQAPRVAGVTVRLKALKNFYETMARQMLIFAFFNTLLAATIAVGVVYNTARIAFSERSRELASLRVLGFRRGEIAYILHGEICVLTLAAIPAGCGLGWGLCALMVQGMQTDLYRIPLVIEPRTYGFAAVVVLAASILSAMVIQRKLNRLDLVAVLKVKE